MADPVMSDFPLRKVLECVERDYLTRKDIIGKHSRAYPMEAWIRFSDKMRQIAFNEKKEEEIDTHLDTLARRGYIHGETGRVHPTNPTLRFSRLTTFYRLTRLGTDALASVKKR